MLKVLMKKMTAGAFQSEHEKRTIKNVGNKNIIPKYGRIIINMKK